MKDRSAFNCDRSSCEAGYVQLFHRGELQERVATAAEILDACTLCPNMCRADRSRGELGDCETGRLAVVSSASPHFGEEDPLRGSRGSGTVFLTHCSLHCVFCQNFDISHQGWGREERPDELAEIMLGLERTGCHNINWVTPDHVVPQLLEALLIAAERGLSIPIVYNSSAFVEVETLKLLDGIVDIYMPDFKFWSENLAEKYLHTRSYPQKARAAIKEMQRQAGDLLLDRNGIAARGVLLRHLVMPGLLDDSRKIFEWLAEEISPDLYINIMGQYRPAGGVSANCFPELNRSLALGELRQAFIFAEQAGLWRFDSRF